MPEKSVIFWKTVPKSKTCSSLFTKGEKETEFVIQTKFLLSSNVNEVIKTILDFFIQNSFLSSPDKLVFVCMYGSTIISVVGPPYPYCSLLAFSAFAW